MININISVVVVVVVVVFVVVVVVVNNAIVNCINVLFYIIYRENNNAPVL